MATHDQAAMPQQAGPAPKLLRPIALTLSPVLTPSMDAQTLADPFAPTPTTPSPMARPPTPGGGPLSSHPATPVNLTDRYAPPPFPFGDQLSPKQEKESQPVDSPMENTSYKPIEETPTKKSPPRSINLEEAAAAYAAAASAPSLSTSRPTSSHLNANFTPIKTGVPPRKPLTPASGNAQKPLSRSNSTGVKKLLSLSSLRSSFSTSSRSSSLALQRTSTGNDLSSSHVSPASTASSFSNKRRGSSPCLTQALNPETAEKYATYSASVVSIAGSPVAESHPSPTTQRIRKRKSGSWFRRASMLMNLDEESKKQPRASPPPAKKQHAAPRGSPDRQRDNENHRVPVLPEFKGLGLENTEKWGEGIFTGIGRSP
ncbi:hypothetical protein K461DRAFT_282633 [Myriangium duriaei CBS 260.36]|uniref:Uncharacterized protein n=1 Tax=Myriangium duriaei CBS 260.36 TaxID=1168546 RepID=A0A9P4MC14_9PEZI|nr:hypothetical protein K461DRAFT_282633 [Myriangium duriaei CBS 260.36]